jgi:hypothetical protein
MNNFIPFEVVGILKIKDLNKKYNYILFNTLQLINFKKTNSELINSFENIVKEHREKPLFNICNLINENFNYYPFECLYFIIYSNIDKNIISTSRIIFKDNCAYIDMVYTNKDYRNKKVCTINISKLIKLTKKYFNIYELEVRPNNIYAIKCYENIGFKFIKTVQYSSHISNLMKLIIK